MVWCLAAIIREHCPNENRSAASDEDLLIRLCPLQPLKYLPAGKEYVAAARRYRCCSSCPRGAGDLPLDRYAPVVRATAWRYRSWLPGNGATSDSPASVHSGRFLTRLEDQQLVEIRDGQEYGVRKADFGALAVELRQTDGARLDCEDV
jgi:hypothetical protein